ncbi:uncharacterized protein FYW49_011964 [Xenentodon cancila]
MCVVLVVFLSTAVLHSVSAGGAYCAKTAQARAAALGLPYPGLHGAPDLSGLAPYVMHPRTYSYDELSASDPNVAVYQQNLPGGSPFDGTVYKQANPRSADRFQLSRGIHTPVYDYTGDQMLGFPRGRSASNPESSFKEVKRVALPTLEEAPSQSDLVNPDPRGRKQPLSFVDKKHDLAVDESAPNRRGMSLSGLTLPRSGGHAAYQGGLIVAGLGEEGFGEEAPVPHSFPFIRGKGKVTKQGPVHGSWKMIRFPSRLTQHLQRGPHVIPFVQGKAVLKRLTKSN